MPFLEYSDSRKKQLRNYYLENGVDKMMPKDALELLLGYAVSGDPGQVCDELFRKFGDVSVILNQSEKSLKNVNGMNDRAAILITMLPYIYTLACSRERLNVNFENVAESCRYFYRELSGCPVEYIKIICLSDRFSYICGKTLTDGKADKIRLSAESLVSSALLVGSHTLIISHNHPGGDCKPSSDDQLATEAFAERLENYGIRLLDHVVVGRNGAFSMLRGRKVWTEDGNSQDVK